MLCFLPTLQTKACRAHTPFDEGRHKIHQSDLSRPLLSPSDRISSELHPSPTSPPCVVLAMNAYEAPSVVHKVFKVDCDKKKNPQVHVHVYKVYSEAKHIAFELFWARKCALDQSQSYTLPQDPDNPYVEGMIIKGRWPKYEGEEDHHVYRVESSDKPDTSSASASGRSGPYRVTKKPQTPRNSRPAIANRGVTSGQPSRTGAIERTRRTTDAPGSRQRAREQSSAPSTSSGPIGSSPAALSSLSPPHIRRSARLSTQSESKPASGTRDGNPGLSGHAHARKETRQSAAGSGVRSPSAPSTPSGPSRTPTVPSSLSASQGRRNTGPSRGQLPSRSNASSHPGN